MMTNMEQQNLRAFSALVQEHFKFIEDFKFCFRGVRVIDSADPRDTSIVARYSGEEFRFDIGWSQLELSLSMLIKFYHLQLPRSKQYVYFEPFIEFLTDGREKAIVPYIRPNMSGRGMALITKRRKATFSNGLSSVMKQIAKKLESHFEKLHSVSEIQIEAYHDWMDSEGRVGF